MREANTSRRENNTIEIYSFIEPIFNEQLLCVVHIISGILEVHAVMNEIVRSKEEKENKYTNN